MLSDVDIVQAMEDGDITISPYTDSQLQPASYDILLGYEFMVFDNTKTSVIDPKTDFSNYVRTIKLKHSSDFIVLHPKEFLLGVSYEEIGVSSKLSCELMGKSSLARLGLIVHTTAGFIDPGNKLCVTLEMVNFNNVPLKLYPKMKIAQIAFNRLDSPTSRPYGSKGLRSKYYGAKTVQASQMWTNYTDQES